MESVLAELGRAFDATLLAVDHRGPDERRDTFAIRGNDVAGDPFGRLRLPALLDELRPDVVLLHHDPALLAVHRDTLAAYGRARVVVYCPVEGDEVPHPSLREADAVVAYTEHGRRALGRARLAVAAVIPHGVDTATFAPGDRAAARRALGLDPDAFYVLNANRNIGRKRIDRTLHAFATLARDRPAARLYLHMGARDGGVDVHALSAQLGIADRIDLTPCPGRRPHVDDERLNLIYNACDVGVNTAAAEGWGLVAFEHAATGAPQVVPAVGGAAEAWGDAAVVLDPAPGPVAAALARLHDDPDERARLGECARAHAASARFAWPAIARAWTAVLRAT